MSPESILILLFVIKHFFCDFIFQTGWMCFNKDRIFHLSGYVHSGVNVLGTIVALFAFYGLSFFISVPLIEVTPILGFLLLGEFVSHYIMDYSKMNISTYYKWEMAKDKQYWNMFGFDQFFHVAYLVIVAGLLI